MSELPETENFEEQANVDDTSNNLNAKTQKAKRSVTMLGNPFDTLLSFLMIALFAGLYPVLLMLFDNGDWTYWVIAVAMGVMTAYFLFMALYKVFRARLPIIKITRDNIRYAVKFRSATIAADDIDITLVDYGKSVRYRFYAYVFDKAKENDGFYIAISRRKTLLRIKDIAPKTFLRFAVSCTDTEILEELYNNGKEDPALVAMINDEIQARIQNREKALKEHKKDPEFKKEAETDIKKIHPARRPRNKKK